MEQNEEAKSTTSISQKEDNDFEGDKAELKLEILENEDKPTYQIRPHLNDKFKPLSAKEIIHSVLFDQLSTKTYNVQDAQNWTRSIADVIKNKIKDLGFQRYKYIVNVVLGEQRGAGVKTGTRCIWDAEADSYAYDNFVNDTIFCSAAVYAVFYY